MVGRFRAGCDVGPDLVASGQSVRALAAVLGLERVVESWSTPVPLGTSARYFSRRARRWSSRGETMGDLTSRPCILRNAMQAYRSEFDAESHERISVWRLSELFCSEIRL